MGTACCQRHRRRRCVNGLIGYHTTHFHGKDAVHGTGAVAVSCKRTLNNRLIEQFICGNFLQPNERLHHISCRFLPKGGGWGVWILRPDFIIPPPSHLEGQGY